jgi:hypothetical protein
MLGGEQGLVSAPDQRSRFNDVGKSAVERSPAARIRVHPTNSLNYFVMDGQKIAAKNRLVMGHPISESAKRIYSSVHDTSRPSPSNAKCHVQSRTPERVVIAWTDQADPEAEMQSGHYVAGSWRSLLDIPRGFPNAPHRVHL